MKKVRLNELRNNYRKVILQRPRPDYRRSMELFQFELPGTLQTWDNWLARHIGHRKFKRPRTHLVSTRALSMQWALHGLDVALAHDTVANDLIATARLVRPIDYALPMKDAYYLISPESSLINPAAKAFKRWLSNRLKG